MLKQLHIDDLRIICQARLKPSAGINVVTGNNGSGKTTVLEAVHLLSRGRSFRHREAAPLIREGTDKTLLVAFLESTSGGKHVIGMERSRTDVTVRVDGRPAGKRSELLRLFPVQWISPEPQLLLTDSPAVRRSFIDRGLFHVEHRYLEVLQQYNRALEQRNAELRRGGQELLSWEAQMDNAAQRLDAWRVAYLDQLLAVTRALLVDWDLQVDLDARYQRGWREGALLREVLYESRAGDRKQKFTAAGPHRADLVIKSANQRSGRRLSRGQLKMLACALFFAQSELTSQVAERREILLFDDLPSELDESNRKKLLASIETRYAQAFITAMTLAELTTDEAVSEVFHVEHGDFTGAG